MTPSTGRPQKIELPPEPRPDDYGSLLFVRLRTGRRLWPVRKVAVEHANTLGASGYARADDSDVTGKPPEPWIPVICEDVDRHSNMPGPVYVLRALTAI